MDPFEIPAFADRRGEPSQKVVVPKRKWIMPTPQRIARLKKENERMRKAIRKAEEKDLALVNQQMDAAEKAARLNKKTS